MRRYLRAGKALCIGLCLVACRKSEPPQEKEPGDLPRELDPPELGARGATDCISAPGRAFTILLAAGERVEVGGSVSVPGGYALSTIAQGARSEVRLFVRIGDRTQDVALGPIYGGGEPARIVAQGGTIFLSWIDADAGGRRARLGAVATSGSALSVRKVIDVDTPLRPLDRIELQVRENRLALAWDSTDPSSSGASSVYCALYDSATLGAVGPPRRISPRGEDASRPILVGRPSGYWLLWVATLERPKGTSESEGGLVDAPPERLRVLELGDDCAPLGAPVDVTPAGENIEFDAASSADSLFVVSKDDRSGAYAVRVVTSSGAVVAKGPVMPLDLELPLLLPSRETPWILARAKDGASLVGRIDPQGPVSLRPEPSLLGAEVLGTVEEGLVLERSRGAEQDGSVLVDVISCGTGAERLK